MYYYYYYYYYYYLLHCRKLCISNYCFLQSPYYDMQFQSANRGDALAGTYQGAVHMYFNFALGQRKMWGGEP